MYIRCIIQQPSSEPCGTTVDLSKLAQSFIQDTSLAHSGDSMAPAMSKRRSRSPHRDLATASAASGLLRALDVEKMQLKLDAGCTAKVLYFADDDIWFEAKPLVLYLDYSPTNISWALGLVKDKNKKSLRELLDAKGSPQWVDWSDQSTPGYHDLKASYINEPGLYSLIFKSTKPQAQDFQDWVYEEVLTALRRRGSYSVRENAELSNNLLAILQKRDEELQLVLQKQQEGFQGELRLALEKNHEEWQLLLDQKHEGLRQILAQQSKQLSLSVVFAMQRGITAALQPLGEALRQQFAIALQHELVQSEQRIVFGLSQRLLDIKNFVKDAVMSPTGVFVDAVRRAVKKPALKTSVDTERFPETQRATSQQLHQDCLDLWSAVHEEMQTAPRGVLPWVKKGPGFKSYRVWKSVRGLLGKRIVALRRADGDLPPTDLNHCALPLLWANCSTKSTTNTGEAAGQRYVYLKEELKRYVPVVLAGTQKVQLTTDGYLATCYNQSQPRRPRARQEMTLRDMLERLQKEEIQQGFEPLQWPVSDLDGNVSIEEMLACEEDGDS